MRINRYVFDEIAVKGVRRWTDADGKKRQETRKFFQTVNPFNKNADGSLKARDQILVEIKAERDAWLRNAA